MSERILKALMQLFAIIAKVEVNEETEEFILDSGGRTIVDMFLRQELNQELVEEYLALFDDHLETHQGKLKKASAKRKRTSVNSVKVLKICTQINEELTQRQKVIVLIRILEFIFANDEVSDQEYEFAETVADTFNISRDEFKLCFDFVKAEADDKIDSPHYLVADTIEENTYEQSEHICHESLIGFLRVVQISSVNTYFVKYYGDHQLYLNGQVLTQDRVHILSQGSSIRSPKVQPIYYSDVISQYLSDESTKKIVFHIDNIVYRFKGGKIGIQPFESVEESGKLIGLMGGSGAGKSTMMNVLNGSYTPSEGRVTINGIDLHHEKKKLEGVIGFVPQDDLLIEELTVFENLFYNAKLCFGNYTDKQITKLVSKTLHAIGLYEAKDLKVGSPLEKTISGGQRKRLNIALELIREPAVMFVDEPTSGLSSRDSENIMDLLKELALKGKLIFVVIHQPSSDIFKMFDKLMILDVGGYPIYNGNPVDAVIYFKKLVNHVNSDESECITCGNVNPEQIFNIIESKVVDEYGNLTPNRKVSPKQWNQYYLEDRAKKQSKKSEYTEIPDSIFKIPNKLKQFVIFFKRDVLSKMTNAQYMMITLFEAPLLALILAFFMKYMSENALGETKYTFYGSENLPQYLFISVIVALFVGLTTSAEEIIGNLKILKREKFLNLSKGSYLFSKIGIMFMISAIQMLFYTVVGNMVLEIHGMNLWYWIILFSTSCFANLLGLNISSSFNSVKVIYILIPILIIPQLLFSGIIVSFDKLHPMFASKSHVPAIGNVMASRWAYEALAVTQFKENEYEEIFFEYDQQMSFANWKKDQWVSNMEGKLKDVVRYIDETDSVKIADDKDEILSHLYIFKNEIEKEIRYQNELIVQGGYTGSVCESMPALCGEIENLSLEKFTPQTEKVMSDFLIALKENYMNTYLAVEQQKDSIQKEFTKPDAAFMEVIDQKKESGVLSAKNHKKVRKLASKMLDLAFTNFRNENKNKALEDFVTAANTLQFTDENHDNIIQKKDPIYLLPYDNDWMRSHFYAPEKKIFGTYIDTFWANVIVIWFMTLLLTITLFTDALKRTLDLLGGLSGVFSGIKLPKKGKKKKKKNTEESN
ncbi:MAG: ATP-binding cassette domain-containing protein [Flavobacteriales bacterium]|nr:ATP-binding cassette domain-containing protein [Flavobacteriales bacterium]